MDFMECLECAVQSGSPILCPICLHNRTAMERLEAENAALRDALRMRPTPAQLADAALGFDHSFGLMSGEDQKQLMHQAEWWLTSWQHVFRAALAKTEGEGDAAPV